MNGKKIKELTDNELTKEFNESLKYCMLLVGIRAKNLPFAEEKDVLRGHIIKNFGILTCKQLIEAFELAITGKLGLSDEEVNPYENFSCLYVSKILKSYILWFNNVHKDDFRKRIQSPEIKYLQAPDVDWSDTWAKLLDLAADNQTYDLLLTTAIYDWLIRINKLNPEIGTCDKYYQDALEAYTFEISKNLREGHGNTPELKRQWGVIENGDWTQDDNICARILTISKQTVIKKQLEYEIKNINKET